VSDDLRQLSRRDEPREPTINCRDGAPDRGRASPRQILDINVLTITGGLERTEPEYHALLDKAGFRLTQVVPTESAVSFIEALPA
jgi:hypothetical protein